MRHKQSTAHPVIAIAGGRTAQQVGFLAIVAFGCLQSHLCTPTEIAGHVLPVANPAIADYACGRAGDGQAGIDLGANIDQAKSGAQPGNQRGTAYATAHLVRPAVIATRYSQKTAADQHSGFLHR